MDWLKRNIWNLLSVFIGIAGLVTGYLYYRLALPLPGVSVLQGPDTLKVIDQSVVGSGALTLTRRDGSGVPGNVYVTGIYVWNSGNTIIKRAAILRSIHLLPAGKVEIIDVKMVRVTRPDILGFSASMDSRGVLLDWGILEPEDGALIQIIYSSDVPVTFKASGVVEGVKSFEVADAPNSYVDLRAAYRTLSLFGFLALLIGIVYGVGFVMQWLTRLLKLEDRSFVKTGKPVFSFLLVAGAVVLIFIAAYQESRKNILAGKDGVVPAGLLSVQPAR